MHNNPPERDTKERILDAAEELFADRGFAATSLRGITTAASVNLAAVNYHFGSKDALLEAVFTRRLGPLNLARIEGLDRLEEGAGTGGAALAAIVEAFVGPALRLSREPRGAVFMRLLGHMLSQRDERIRERVTGQFQQVIDRFSAALARALPALPPGEIYWRLLFTVGAMAHTMALADKLPAISRGACDPSDAEAVLARLVAFVAAGLGAPAPGATGSNR